MQSPKSQGFLICSAGCGVRVKCETVVLRESRALPSSRRTSRKTVPVRDSALSDSIPWCDNGKNEAVSRVLLIARKKTCSPGITSISP